MLFLIFSSLLDVTGLVSILPFIAILTNPDIIQDNHILNNIFLYSQVIGIKNEKEFLILSGFFTFIIFTLTLILRAFLAYFTARFSAITSIWFKTRLYGYLNKPYDWFLNRNSSELGKNILSEVSIVISTGLIPLLYLIIYINFIYFYFIIISNY